MRRQLSFAILCFVALMGLSLAACHKDDVVVPEPNDTTNVTDTIPEEPTYSIIGTWKLDSATQDVSGNLIDITPFYGEEFYLTFREDGELITSDGTNEVSMDWVMEGDQVGFIQAPGLDPVMYTVATLTADSLVLVNGEGTGYVTTMNLHRI